MATEPSSTTQSNLEAENTSHVTPSKPLQGRSKTRAHSHEAKAALERWFQTLRERFAVAALRALVRSSVIIGFLACCYLIGWWSPKATGTWLRFTPLLTFIGFGVGLWFYGKNIQISPRLHRWLMLLPAGFLLSTLLHFAALWVVGSVFGFFVLLSLILHTLKEKERGFKHILKECVLDSIVIALALSNLFLPRTLFGAFIAFLPSFILVVFYNFILERDRLLRAKALAIGAPPAWLKRANQLIPSSTYLFLLLPGLLFAEAMLFHASFDLTHENKGIACKAQAKGNPRVPPKLRDWFAYTITVRMKVRHCNDPATPNPDAEEVSYWEFSKGYSLTATLIRAFLLFFYAKRILLIFLLLMDSTYGIRVHRLGKEKGSPGADARLDEHREVVQRTIDSFPRAWAGLLVRGIQGKHGGLDPIGGLLYSFQWFQTQVIPKWIPKMEVKEAPAEPEWSRLVREEQIKLLGKMQDRAWALEACIDLISPLHSSTFRGRAYHLLDYPILRPFLKIYFQPPEAEIRAQIIEEVAALMSRAVHSENSKITLQDTETEELTHEQIWTLRDRALLVLKDLLSAPEQCIRISAAKAIDRIADLPRPIRSDDMEIWHPLTDSLGERIQALAPTLDPSTKRSSEPLLKHLELQSLRSSTTQIDTDSTDEEELQLDPFAWHLEGTPQEELESMLSALGRVGIREALEWLDAWSTEESVPEGLILYAMGLGERANGRPHSGFSIAQQHLLRSCQQVENKEHQRIALKSLVRIAFPQPIAETFEQYVILRRTLHTQQQELELHHRELRQFERSQTKQSTLNVQQREALRTIYDTLRDEGHAHEALALRTLEPLHDTFWMLLHYSASVLVSAFIEHEGFDKHPEFSEYLQQLSLEDIQGWNEFIAQLPDIHDSTSWIAPFHRFVTWVAQSSRSSQDEDAVTERSPIEHFVELKSLADGNDRQKEDVSRWEELFALNQQYEQFLLETLLQFTPCLRVRPTITVHLEEEDQSSWWRLTLTGLEPWVQALQEAPQHTQPEHLYLSYEQYTPLSFHPVAEVTWSEALHPSGIQHGHIPKPFFWGFNLTRGSELILRQLSSNEHRSYWRATEKPGDLKQWKLHLQQLLHEQRNVPLSGVNIHYLKTRSLACYQQVFTRSRLREQAPLMIRREMASKLDNFLEHNRRKNAHAPSIFLLAGEAGMGHTTLLLQHIRQWIQDESNPSMKKTKYIALFADIGLFEPNDSLVEWLYRELHIEHSQDEVKRWETQEITRSMAPFLLKLDAFCTSERIDFCLYADGFHEHPRGIELLAQIFSIADYAYTRFPWFRLILSVRQHFLEQHIHHPALAQHTHEGSISLKESMFYQEKGGLHGVVMKLSPFYDELTPESTVGRSEIERAFGRYYNFTDTSGKPRYRPKQEIHTLEPFGMTRTLLGHPSLLPVIMETYHNRELPDDIYILSLFSSYMERFAQPEQDFLKKLAQSMLFGSTQPTAQAQEWHSSALIPESLLLQEPTFSEYIESFKYGVSVYDELRARGILIRRWRLTEQQDEKQSVQQRHVTCTSPQLLEYLLYRELWGLAPEWLYATTPPKEHTSEISTEDIESIVSPSNIVAGIETQETKRVDVEQSVAWLLSIAQHSDTFRPLEGALMLLLLHLLEHHHYDVVARFNDQSQHLQDRGHYLLFGALLHMDPRAITRKDGPFDTVLVDISTNDLELLQELARHFKHRSLYQEVDALCGLALDHPDFSEQLHAFPSHMTDLLLERADNRRHLFTQNTKDEKAYLDGRSHYEKALERIREQTGNIEQEIRVLRFLALYEMDTDHTSEAEDTLQRAWKLTSEESLAEHPQRIFHQAWIRHIQSALQRRKAEAPGCSTHQKINRLHQAKPLGEEALQLAESWKGKERLDLLAQVYDNLGRIFYQIAKESKQSQKATDAYQHALEMFQGSLHAKRSLHDYLGMAISHSGMGSVYLDRALLNIQEETPEENDWNEAKTHFERALKLNQEKLHSDFGCALGHQALADLYLLHPEYHADGLTQLVEALSAYARIHNTQGCHQVIQKLVKEITKLPLQEMHRFLKQLIFELQHIHDLSEWLIKTLWEEFSAVLDNRIPKVLKDVFAKMIQS